MIFSKLADFIKRFDVLLISVIVLAFVAYSVKDTHVEPDLPVGYGLMVYMCVWSMFAFVRWYNGKRWNY